MKGVVCPCLGAEDFFIGKDGFGKRTLENIIGEADFGAVGVESFGEDAIFIVGVSELCAISLEDVRWFAVSVVSGLRGLFFGCGGGGEVVEFIVTEFDGWGVDRGVFVFGRGEVSFLTTSKRIISLVDGISLFVGLGK